MSTSEIAILQARVAQLQALNRRYLDSMREVGDEYDRQTEEFLQLHARVRDLEARPPPVTEPPSTDRVLGCSTAQFLKGMEIIMRDTGKAFPEAFTLWQLHAAECEEERQAEARANASRDGMRAYLGAWMQEGMPRKKAICACGEWDCPTNDLTYVVGRGFVDGDMLAREEEAAPPPPKPLTWAQRVLAGTK